MSTPTVIQSCAALYGIVPGAAGVTFVNGQIGTDKAFATEDAMLNHYYEATFTVWVPKTTAEVASLIVANLGLTGATATSEAARIAGLLDGVAMPARGAKVKEIVTEFEATPAAATFNAAKAALVTAVADPTYVGIPDKGVGDLVFASLSPTQIQLGTSEAINTVLLTTGVDTVPGSTGVDVITGTVSSLQGTLQATDVIDGAGGNDRLEVAMDIAFTGFSTGSVKNVETISITNNGATARDFNANGITGATTFSVDATNGAVNLVSLPTGVETISLKAQSGSTSGTTFATGYVSGAAEQSSSTTAVTFNVAGVGTSATARVTATLADVQALTVGATGTNFLSIGGTQATSLKITGSGSLNATVANSSAIKTVDGSAATGALTLNLSGVSTGNTITSIKTGSGDDTITLAQAGVKANLTVDGGAGADILNLSGGVVTVAYALPGIETVNFVAITGDQVHSATGWSDLKTISTKGGATSHTDANVTLAGLGAKDITLNVLGSSVTGKTTTVDNSGAAVLNFKADGTDAKAGTGQDSPLGNVTFSKAASLVATVEPFVKFGTAPNTHIITASEATAVTLNVSSGKLTAGTEQSGFGGALAAPKATSFTLASTGGTLTAATVNAPLATSGSITNGGQSGSVTLTDGSKLTSLSITSGEALAVTNTEALAKVQSLTIAANKGAVSFVTNPDFVAANAVTLSGSGTASSVTLGDLGAIANGYDLTVTASGTLNGASDVHGVAIGDVLVAAGKNVTMSFADVTGSVNIGAIADPTDRAGTVTITAPKASTGTSSKDTGLVVGNVEATGAVTIDASGAATASIANNGTIRGSAVSVDMSKMENSAYSLGAITASSSVNLALNPLGAANTSISITGTDTSTGLTVALAGGVNKEDVTITATGSSVANITLTGDGVAGDDTLVVDGRGSKAKAISISGFSNYANSTIHSSTGNDTIVGGAGADRIEIFGGVNSITGGAGADVFFFQAGTSNYTKVNTITDFGATDRIVFDVVATNPGHVIPATVGAQTAVVSPAGGVTGAAGTVTIAASSTSSSTSVGVATFTGTSTGFDSLAKKAGILSATFDTVGQTVFFADSGNTYVFVSGGTANDATNDLVVQLVGVALPTVSAPGVSTTETGILGFGS
jgi:hypothetical protein